MTATRLVAVLAVLAAPAVCAPVLVQRRSRFATWAWTVCACGICALPILAPWFSDRSRSPGSTLLIAIAGVVVMLKATGWLARPRQLHDPLRVALVLSIWPALEVDDVGIRLPALGERIRAVSLRLAAGVASLTCGLALATLGYRLDVRERGLLWDTSFKTAEICLLAGGLNHLLVGSMGLAGYRVRDGFRYPVLARSILDFWSRYDVWIQRWLKRYIFKPIVKRFRSPVTGILAVFAFSGIWHEYLFISAAPYLLGWQLAFFMLHGVGASAAARVGRSYQGVTGRRFPRALAVAATLVFVLASMPIFIHCLDPLFDLHQDLGGWVLGALRWSQNAFTKGRA
jgi:hypothetical protein